ncbi:MAG: helix-turn-helix domain-containing protein [Nitrospira sp.]|jgi:excisionase family DNA binding protein|nr:helix-turn-helix domain-containing protein [Nitrospira sp.]MBS0154610.1 helix-turn-helix domain-containing protein [Nitrospira sp.]MBS0166438.1 helix-turn-helix domain-containing protein [Nitrospira sp.]
MEPLLLRIQEAAKVLQVSKWTIYRWIDEGRLRGTKIGQGSLRVFRTSVNELVERAKVEREDTRRSLRSTSTERHPTKRKLRS